MGAHLGPLLVLLLRMYRTMLEWLRHPSGTYSLVLFVSSVTRSAHKTVLLYGLISLLMFSLRTSLGMYRRC
jgi:hypothetical protein